MIECVNVNVMLCVCMYLCGKVDKIVYRFEILLVDYQISKTIWIKWISGNFVQFMQRTV